MNINNVDALISELADKKIADGFYIDTSKLNESEVNAYDELTSLAYEQCLYQWENLDDNELMDVAFIQNNMGLPNHNNDVFIIVQKYLNPGDLSSVIEDYLDVSHPFPVKLNDGSIVTITGAYEQSLIIQVNGVDKKINAIDIKAIMPINIKPANDNAGSNNLSKNSSSPCPSF